MERLKVPAAGSRRRRTSMISDRVFGSAALPGLDDFDFHAFQRASFLGVSRWPDARKNSINTLTEGPRLA
jgi:hypothetical protein